MIFFAGIPERIQFYSSLREFLQKNLHFVQKDPDFENFFNLSEARYNFRIQFLDLSEEKDKPLSLVTSGNAVTSWNGQLEREAVTGGRVLTHLTQRHTNHVRDNTMVDLQAQLKDLQRENEILRKELEIKDTKLGSSMNSIKTFWSPELKKERVLRKEEAARMSVLKEQMRVSHEESQHLQLTIQALQDELRTQRDLNHLLQQENVNRGAEHYTIELTEENFRRLQAEHERQAKELFLLRKTLEEMELRIETQKQTLNARDESIKKLLEMLQSKGLPSKSMEEEHERSRRISEAESQVNHLEVLLDQKEKENNHLKEVCFVF
ncbi:hypothetical protein scyTo_0004095 [Scyliorhinus torazame]|uniref:Uncharacterized protein n=1 Tax=Scyliorhinus torazame TaxID=75743 RepID=A0A401NKS9_SCYTO|nr:hypothetical protein [Scyliorhinus torazame]